MSISKLSKRISRILCMLLCCMLLCSTAMPVFATEAANPTGETDTTQTTDPAGTTDTTQTTDPAGETDTTQTTDPARTTDSTKTTDTTAAPASAGTSGSGTEAAPAAETDDGDSIVVEDEKPNTDIEVIPSNANALLLMDAGAESPRGIPGDVVTVVLTMAVNREYLPSEKYMLRNITITPDIPTDTSVKNWPFDLINASYTRHLEDMSYNSTAEVYYDFRISEFATRGIYPVNFKANATVWRYDDVNGTNIEEDVTFNLCVYVTIVGDGGESGVQTAFGPLQLAAANDSGTYQAPVLSPKQTVTLQIPVENKGGELSDVTISPIVSTSLDEFPFVAQNINYGTSYSSWSTGKIRTLEYTFTVSEYATNGNKPIKFRATYYENGVANECTFESYVYIINGYEAEVETAMSVMVTEYQMYVEDTEVSGLMAGDEAVLKVTLKNNAAYDTSYKNIAALSLTNAAALQLTTGYSDAAYVRSIAPGKTAEVEFHVTVKRDAEVGPTSLGINLTYETGDSVAGKAAQTIMIPISQPMDVVIDEPVVYGTARDDTPTSINLNMINKGRGKALNVSILATEGISMAESYFGGDILPGGTLSADFQVNCKKAGSFTGLLIVQYEDANGQQYTQEVQVPLNVVASVEKEADEDAEAAAAMAEANASGGVRWWLWLIILILIILIVLVVLYLLKLKKSKENEDDASADDGSDDDDDDLIEIDLGNGGDD